MAENVLNKVEITLACSVTGARENGRAREARERGGRVKGAPFPFPLAPCARLFSPSLPFLAPTMQAKITPLQWLPSSHNWFALQLNMHSSTCI